MNFSLNSQRNNRTAANGNESEMNEEIKMKNADTNIQMNSGNIGALAIKNSMRFLGGLALAGMVVMATTFGSVSADSPSVSTSFVAHGPNEMDIEYLNNLGRGYINLGPDVVERTSASAFFIHGPDVVELTSASAFSATSRDTAATAATAWPTNSALSRAITSWLR